MLNTVPSGTTGALQQDNLLRVGQQALIWNQQTIVSGTASGIYQLERQKGPYNQFGASFQFRFSATPGAFQIDVQTSDTGDPNEFVSISSITGGLNSSFVGRIELPNFWALFVRLNAVTITNNVTLTALVTR